MFYDVSSQKVTRGGHTRALDVDVTDILDVLRRLIPKGYKGGHTAAYDYMNKIIERFHIDIAVYKSSSSDAIQKKKKLQKYDHLSRNGIFRFLWMNQEITDSHKSYLVETYPQLRTLMSCIREFREIFQRKSMPCLYLFIEKYKNSDLKELSRFASGLEKDLSAVENAVASPLSNGFVEGTNSKLKMIKRTMYGRCGKELLAAKLMPYGYWLANLISKRLDTLREKTQIFLPDGKVQILVSDDEIVEISVNVQHVLNADMQRLNYQIREECLFDVKAKKMIINQDTGFVRGGIENDTGLTGRKMMVDTYGGLVPHGGGAFSGKDPSKVDRSAAYMCRYVAKNIVANGLAKECCVSVAYNFGEENPIMVNVETDRNNSNNISKIILQNFDFRPQAIIERLNLKGIKYQPTATYGHFTNDVYPWEKIVELV